MIRSALEFYRLRCSQSAAEQARAAAEEAPLEVWLHVIELMPDMRVWVAHNKTVPIEVLEKLAGDADGRVRHMVASKNKLPPALQMKLAADADVGVRQALVRKRKLGREALRTLADDPDPEIRTMARERLVRDDA